MVVPKLQWPVFCSIGRQQARINTPVNGHEATDLHKPIVAKLMHYACAGGRTSQSSTLFDPPKVCHANGHCISNSNEKAPLSCRGATEFPRSEAIAAQCIL